MIEVVNMPVQVLSPSSPVKRQRIQQEQEDAAVSCMLSIRAVSQERSSDPCLEQVSTTDSSPDAMSPKKTPHRPVRSEAREFNDFAENLAERLVDESRESSIAAPTDKREANVDKSSSLYQSAPSADVAIKPVVSQDAEVILTPQPRDILKADSKAYYQHPFPDVPLVDGCTISSIKLASQAALGTLSTCAEGAFVAPTPVEMLQYQIRCLDTFMQRYSEFYYFVKN